MRLSFVVLAGIENIMCKPLLCAPTAFRAPFPIVCSSLETSATTFAFASRELFGAATE